MMCSTNDHQKPESFPSPFKSSPCPVDYLYFAHSGSKHTYRMSCRVVWCQMLTKVCLGIAASRAATNLVTPYRFLQNQQNKESYLLLTGSYPLLVELAQLEDALGAPEPLLAHTARSLVVRMLGACRRCDCGSAPMCKEEKKNICAPRTGHSSPGLTGDTAPRATA